MNETAPEPNVERIDAEHRYEITVEGRPAGKTEYRDHGEQRVFFHTEIDRDFARQGLAGKLVEHALADVRDSGMRVVPVCPYVARYLKRHDGFADIADPVTQEILAWLEAELGSS